jgi:hypothetical protein
MSRFEDYGHFDRELIMLAVDLNRSSVSGDGKVKAGAMLFLGDNFIGCSSRFAGYRFVADWTSWVDNPLARGLQVRGPTDSRPVD